MKFKITKVTTPEQIKLVAALADEIWHQHFTPIIGLNQVEYMISKFQSVPAITAQIEESAEYYIAEIDGRPIGYTCLIPDREKQKMMISKLYLLLAARGTGAGKNVLAFIEETCVKRKYKSMWLTVNRFNDGPIEWYKRRGFVVINEIKKDIDGGFFMDDYIMEKTLDD